MHLTSLILPILTTLLILPNHAHPSTVPNLSERALGLGAPCDEAPKSCSKGLVCTGPENHQKCQCNKPKCYSYNSKRQSGIPGCREDSNPGGLGYTMTTVCGYGDALVADVGEGDQRPFL